MLSNQADNAYHDLVEEIYDHGEEHENRTNIPTKRIWGHMVKFDLQRGFPLLTSKKMAVKAAFTELLGFVRGETDVRWYQERGCNIWNADHERWHGKDLERDRSRLVEMRDQPVMSDGLPEDPTIFKDYCYLEASIRHREDNPHSLGLIYGRQWRDFGGTPELFGDGYDQLAEIIEALKAGSNSRRLIMSAWHPTRFVDMCLPPCHIAYHFVKRGDFLDIAMWQRSCDVALGVPFNWATTALLCHLVAAPCGLKPGKMVWFGDDVHIYGPHLEAVYDQVHREPRMAPSLLINRDPQALPWEIEYEDLQVVDYDPHPKVNFELFVG